MRRIAGVEDGPKQFKVIKLIDRFILILYIRDLFLWNLNQMNLLQKYYRNQNLNIKKMFYLLRQSRSPSSQHVSKCNDLFIYII